MLRKFLFLFLFLLILMLSVTFEVSASEPYIFYDNYTDVDLVDIENTNAYIDVEKETEFDDGEKDIGVVTLQKTYSNVLDFTREGLEYAVLNDGEVEVYSFDGSRMVKNEFLSFEVGDALGISTRCLDTGIVVLDEENVKVYNFDGSGMSENPFLKVMGIESPLSMITVKNDEITVLDSDANVTGYAFNGEEMVRNESISILGENIEGTMLASGKSEYEYRVLDNQNNSVISYAFTGGGMVENPFLKIAGLENPTYVSVKRDTYDTVVIDDNNIKYFQFSGEGMVENTILSLSKDKFSIAEPKAVAINPEEYGVALVDGEDIRYFQFDGVEMVENTSLKVSGINIDTGGFISGKVYQTKPINPSEKIRYLYVEVKDNRPEKTDILYEFSVDGGSNWDNLVFDDWLEIEESDNIVIRAYLITEDKEIAPEIYNLKLYGANVNVTYLEDKRYEKELPTSKLPVKTGSGYYIGFYVYTGGELEDLKTTMYEEEEGVEGVYSKEISMKKQGNKWDIYTYTDERLEEGDLVNLLFESPQYPKVLSVDPFVLIMRNIYDDIGDRISVELRN